MGLFDLFSGSGRASRAERQVERSSKKLVNKHIQTAERKRCIELLEDAGTAEAIAGLLMRFTYRTDVQIVDEDEKETVYQALLRLGPKAIGPIEKFVHDELAIYWAVRALAEIAGEAAAVELLIREIDGITEGYDRDVAHKHELVSNLREFQAPQVFEKLIALLADEQEEVRILAIDGLSLYDGAEPVDALVPLLLDDEQSHRVKQMVLDLLIQRGWNVRRYKKELSPKLPEIFWIDDVGTIRRR